MPTVIIIEGLYAVGMRFNGPRELRVDHRYFLQREENNRYDRNAICIQDDTTTRAYLTRSSARKLAPVMDRDIFASKVCLKAKRRAEFRNNKLEQFCNVAFLVKEDELELLRSLFRVAHI
jgi:hypothetical protein